MSDIVNPVEANLGRGFLRFHLRTQELVQDERGYSSWRPLTTVKDVFANACALILCDVWDNHWSRGATERVSQLAPRLNRVVREAREQGVQIIHAPSETMAAYAQSPARQRMMTIPQVELPSLVNHPNPSLPIDDSDGGSDTGEASWYKAWTCQHHAIEIDQEKDVISDDGQEIYSFIRHRGIEQVLIAGVHTNMCVLRRPFAIMALVRRGIPVALVRDLTDAMYNPAMRPYVSHDEGTRLVVDYIEKFWCPSITSDAVRVSTDGS